MAVARKWLDEKILAATNTNATIEELLDVVFSIRFVSYQIINLVSSIGN
jgi:hypothetical protein